MGLNGVGQYQPQNYHDQQPSSNGPPLSSINMDAGLGSVQGEDVQESDREDLRQYYANKHGGMDDNLSMMFE